MEICDTFEQNLSLCKKQYKEECLSSHMPDMFLYTMRAEKLLKAGASPESICKELGDVTLIRVRCTMRSARILLCLLCVLCTGGASLTAWVFRAEAYSGLQG